MIDFHDLHIIGNSLHPKDIFYYFSTWLYHLNHLSLAHGYFLHYKNKLQILIFESNSRDIHN